MPKYKVTSSFILSSGSHAAEGAVIELTERDAATPLYLRRIVQVAEAPASVPAEAKGGAGRKEV